MTISRSPSDQTSWRAPCRTRRQPREHSLFSRSRRFMGRIYTYTCNCQDSSRVRLYPRFYVGERGRGSAARSVRANEKNSRSVAIGCIAFVMCFYEFLKDQVPV